MLLSKKKGIMEQFKLNLKLFCRDNSVPPHFHQGVLFLFAGYLTVRHLYVNFPIMGAEIDTRDNVYRPMVLSQIFAFFQNYIPSSMLF